MHHTHSTYIQSHAHTGTNTHAHVQCMYTHKSQQKVLTLLGNWHTVLLQETMLWTTWRHDTSYWALYHRLLCRLVFLKVHGLTVFIAKPCYIIYYIYPNNFTTQNLNDLVWIACLQLHVEWGQPNRQTRTAMSFSFLLFITSNCVYSIEIYLFC